jgi:hypothetical protein
LEHESITVSLPLSADEVKAKATNSKCRLVEEAPDYNEVGFKTRDVAKATWKEKVKKCFACVLTSKIKSTGFTTRTI